MSRCLSLKSKDAGIKETRPRIDVSLYISASTIQYIICTVFISASISVSSVIRQGLFRQNVVSENSPKFNDVKVCRYTV